jgi:hypothetical protein
MAEKRRNTRRKVRIRCHLLTGRQRAPGTVVDVSRGGIAVQSRLKLKPGQAVRVELIVPNREALLLDAMVGNGRQVKSRASGSREQVIGLVVKNAPPELLALADTGAAPPPNGERSYLVRMAHSGGPEEQSIVVEARSPQEAERRALVRVGDGWRVMDASRAG